MAALVLFSARRGNTDWMRAEDVMGVKVGE